MRHEGGGSSARAGIGQCAEGGMDGSLRMNRAAVMDDERGRKGAAAGGAWACSAGLRSQLQQRAGGASSICRPPLPRSTDDVARCCAGLPIGPWPCCRRRRRRRAALGCCAAGSWRPGRPGCRGCARRSCCCCCCCWYRRSTPASRSCPAGRRRGRRQSRAQQSRQSRLGTEACSESGTGTAGQAGGGGSNGHSSGQAGAAGRLARAR